MPVPSAITDLSTSAAGNSPAGSDTVFPNLDDYIRALSAFIAQNYASLATKQASLGYTPVNKAGDTLTGVLAATKGTAALPGIAFSGDTNTGIHSSGADILDLVTAGASRLRVDASGRVLFPARTQPCFRMNSSAWTTDTSASVTFATYASKTDDGSHSDLTTGLFTAPINGWYEFSAMPVVSSSTAVSMFLKIVWSGVGHLAAVKAVHSGTGDTYCALASGPVYLTAGSTVGVQSGGVISGSFTGLGARAEAFSGRLLG